MIRLFAVAKGWCLRAERAIRGGMTKPILFDYWRSSASYRVRIALNLKRASYDSVSVDLRSGAQQQADYRTRNPQGLVPMLEMDGLKLTQSLAIIDYLDAVIPEPQLV